MKPIFQNYTGSAFLNTALQTIEVLAGVDKVSEVTTATLLEVYKKYKIWALFKRMKSYSMLFSRNGPLLNDKDFGEKIFKGIIEHTLANFETTGSYQCEISGLRFETPFANVYEQVLHQIKYPVKKIKAKDKTINRCWFPLSGALGSDAQALPQAVFDLKIHPICLVLIQFLPFSALLYKGGVLLLDTSDFVFSKDFIEQSVKRVLKEIEITPSNQSVENIRDFTQGDYILKAIEIYSEQKTYYEVYTDLNLWSFSNSGTGASCQIDRIPNAIFRQLYQLYIIADCKNDLVKILKSPFTASFLESLLMQKDYWGLYPRTVKKKVIEGVNVPFYDAYQKIIGRGGLINYAKYIAYLIHQEKEKSNAEIKLLEKLDAYKAVEYNTLVYSVLLKATQKGKWTLKNYLEILDATNQEVITFWTYRIYKMVHFYYLQQSFEKTCPLAQPTSLSPIMATFIHCIEEDSRREGSIKKLINAQQSDTYNINPVLIRSTEKISLTNILQYTYRAYQPQRKGLNKLLRIYFNQPQQDNDFSQEYLAYFQSPLDQSLEIYAAFAQQFETYYLEKYHQDRAKYERYILKSFPTNSQNFKTWLQDVWSNMQVFYSSKPDLQQQVADFEEGLMYDPEGEFNISFARFAVQFLLHQSIQ